MAPLTDYEKHLYFNGRLVHKLLKIFDRTIVYASDVVDSPNACISSQNSTTIDR